MPKLIVNDPARPVQGPRANPQDFGAGVARESQRLGRTVQGLADIPAAYSAMKANRQAAEFRVALQGLSREMSLTNDLENASATFAAERKRLEKQFRGGSTGIFDQSASLSGDAIQNEFDHKIRVRQVEAGLHEMDETLRLHADEVAIGGDAIDRSNASIRAELVIEDAVASGLLDESGADEAKARFNKMAMGGVMRRLQNDDPASGLAFLESGEFQGTEQERQVWRGHMMAAQRALVNAELSAIRKANAADQRRQKVLGDQAEKTLIEKAFGDGFTEEDVLQFASFFSPTELGNLLSQARSGGRFVAKTSDPRAWDELRTLATIEDPDEAGDQVEGFEDQARKALFRGQLSQSDYGSLLKLYEDTRIGQWTEMIENSIAGNVFAGPGDKLNAREAASSFIEWYAGRTEELGDVPSLTESREFADRQVEAAMLSSTESTAFQLVPSRLVGTRNEPDIPATKAKIRAALKSGEMDAVEARIEIRRAIRLDEIVKAKAAKAQTAAEAASNAQ